MTIGARTRRVEDPRLIQGQGRYVGDITPPGTLHAAFVRSPHAHARIAGIDISTARDMAGVVAVYSAADLPELGKQTPVAPIPPGIKGHGYYPLARDVVRYAGEPVAVVIGDDPYLLADAAEAVEVAYEPLEAVTDPVAAMDRGPVIWDDVPGNRALDMTLGFGVVDEAFERADVVVSEEFAFARAAGAALEPRSVLAVPDEDGNLTLWDSTQAPHNVRDSLAQYFEMDASRIRVIAPDVGGGFGPKGRGYPEEYIVAALALRHNRPVRFVATRTEDLLTTAQGRGQVHRASLAARSDGTILALRDHIIQDAGAYTPGGAPKVLNTTRHLMGPYRVPALETDITAVYTNKVPSSPLRGGGRPQGIYVMERLLDRLAQRLGIDRAEIRSRNFIPPDAFPYDTGMPNPGGGTVVYDSGNFPAYLQAALDAIGYDGFRERQEGARKAGHYLGLGLVAFIESTGVGVEGARAEMGGDGRVSVHVGSPSNGQGHATTFAQIAAERLGLPLETVEVHSGDTGAFPWGTGTFASRMGTYGGNAVSLAAGELREKLVRLAADMLEIAPADLELRDGTISVRGLPERGVALMDVVVEAGRRGEALEATGAFRPERQSTWAGGVNAAIVEVDIETGHVTIRRYVVVHDSGTIVNPTVVEGQIHGGVAHGIGNALFEEFIYDSGGQPATATFMDYTLPSIGDVPFIDIEHFETPSPFNPEGIKGAGEGGTIAAIPTLVSAVEDALSPFGATFARVPIRGEDIVTAAKSGLDLETL